MISVIIITKNEEEMLPQSLQSVGWADEIVVVDTGSVDKTVEIAKRHGAIVIKSTGKTFSDWRNDGLKKAKGDWILYLDADEEVTPELKKEIKSIVLENDLSFGMYAIARRNIILGKEFKHGGFWPDYVKRLFNKSKLKKWEGELHEEPVYEGKMGHIEKPMIHLKHENFSQMVEKTNTWSEIEAKLMYEASHPPMNVARFVSAMAREFFYRMVKKRAFLDGPEGIMFAMYQVYSRFVSYAKLWELQEKERMGKIN